MNFDLALSTDVPRRTPETLRELLGDLPEPWVRGTEGAETFSPFDVIPMKWLKVLHNTVGQRDALLDRI